MNNRPSIGIIGYGSFGAFLAKHLSTYAPISVYNRTKNKLRDLPVGVSVGTLDEVASQSVIIVAINISAYDSTLPKIAQFCTKNTLVVDVASVKLEPLRLISKYLPSCNVLATHPLFGPQSASDSLNGHTIVICNKIRQQTQLEHFLIKVLGLRIVHMSADEHDRNIATVQALTFFIAQGLVEMNLADPALLTPSFEKLLKLAELEQQHTPELFETIQKYNPYAEKMRKKFIRELSELDKKIIT